MPKAHHLSAQVERLVRVLTECLSPVDAELALENVTVSCVPFFDRDCLISSRDCLIYDCLI